MMLRSFIALEVPPEIQDAIARSIAPLQITLPKPLIRWVVAQNVHLTLKFLGDISPANLERLADDLKVEARNHEPFSMAVEGLGAFPNPRRARVIWIGLESPGGLKTLTRNVEMVAAKLGYPMDDRPFSPHLTVGRVGSNVSGAGLQTIHTALEGYSIGKLGTLLVNAVHIFKSDLRTEGSVYTHMYTLPMKPTQARL
jgi:2'-5' RNA ligase